jgi:peptidoglycan hydrolase CwlO-like protein
MSFNLQKYLIENNLTIISKRRISEDVDPDETPEPTKDDMKQTDQEVKNLQKNKKELAALQAKAKDIMFKYTVDTPQGRKIKGSIDDYKRAIGDIPKKIKELQKKIKPVENPTANDTDEQDEE